MKLECSKKMYELGEQIRTLSAEARKLLDSGDGNKAKEKLAELDALKDAYNAEKSIFDAEQALVPDEKKAVSGTTAEKQPDAVELWTKALRRKFSDYDANEAYKATILTEGTSATAGYTVPQDISTAIHSYKTNRFSFEPYVRKEAVNTKSGSRVFRKRNTTAAFSQVNEGAAIPLTAVPEYEQVTYSIKNFGGIIQVTNDLFDDTAANLRAEITKHLAWCREDTMNTKILAQLTAKAETALAGGIPSLRTALIKTLGGEYTATSKIYTNDDGYAYLCNLQDTANRDYFFYDPRSGGQPAISIGGIIVPVVHVPNSVLASASATNNRTKMPFIIGDLEEAVTIFDRKQISIAASNEASITYTTGTGNEAVTTTVSAFQNNLTFFRAYMRADFVTVDSSAWLNCSITA